MTKSELVKELKAAGIKDPAASIDAITNIIAEKLASGEDISISGFGTFAVKEIQERQAHNPATGEAIIVPRHRKVTFKPGKKLKEMINANL